ncbi:inner membrane protein YjcH [Escherichia coli]|uniref:Inner membrane protein YjcH n=1 Tax=Escherichia coli TaxID=562 RepID=A0A2X3KHJ4_ECOLX|nr:inner membrane protein YjcH [Escherichia coli]
MNGTIYQRIEDNAHFRELVEKRQRFATIPVDYYAGSLYRLYFTDRLRARLAGHAAEIRTPASHAVFQLVLE